MNTAVDNLVHPMVAMSICSEMFGEQQQRRFTLEERRNIAGERLRKAKQVDLLVAWGVARCPAYFLNRSIPWVFSPQTLFSQCKRLSYI